jgi:hypothetical protein
MGVAGFEICGHAIVKTQEAYDSFSLRRFGDFLSEEVSIHCTHYPLHCTHSVLHQVSLPMAQFDKVAAAGRRWKDQWGVWTGPADLPNGIVAVTAEGYEDEGQEEGQAEGQEEERRPADGVPNLRSNDSGGGGGSDGVQE